MFPEKRVKGPDAVRRSYAIEITKLVEYVDKESYANADSQKAPTQINSAVLRTDVSRQNYSEEQYN